MTYKTIDQLLHEFMEAFKGAREEERAEAAEEFFSTLENRESLSSQFRKIMEERQAQADERHGMTDGNDIY